jgi:hypothetical protein
MSLPSRRITARSATGQVFLPPSRQGAIVPGAIGGVALLLGLGLIVRGLVIGISFASFLMFVVGAVLVVGGGLALYVAWACATLRYTLDQGVLRIDWGLTRHEIPVARFGRVVRGRPSARLRVDGLSWPGCHIGEVTAPRVGRVRVFSLHRTPAEVLYLLGDGVAYAIAVADRAAFTRALQGEMEYRAPIDEPRVVTPPVVRALSWRDRPAQAALGAAAVLALIATAIVFSRYAGFPDEIVRNFPEESRVGGRAALLGIPAAAWALLLLNGAAGIRLATTRRAAAFTLLYGLEFIEALLVIASITAV